MFKYILKRLAWMIPILLCVTILIFTIMYFVPGDVARIKLGSNAEESEVIALRETLGLNDPYHVRLGNYLKGVFLHFDFGDSLIDGTPVMKTLVERTPRTLVIAVLSTVFAALIGTPLGITAATHEGSIRDRLAVLVSLIGVSIPSFWLALLLVILFAVKLGWLPSQGIGSFSCYILPCISAGFMTIALQTRQTRSCLLEALREDYVITARAKGVSERGIVYGHALPNAMIPIITNLCGAIGGKMAGALVIENIFAIPGIGQYLIRSINNRDYYGVQGAVIYFAFILCIMNLITDLLYAYVDPRIRAQFEGQGKKKKQKEASS